jgi:hypothetical protein
MLKYASKLLLDISFSVLATVIGSYLVHHYFAGRPTATAPVSLAYTAIDPKAVNPKAVDANASHHEMVRAEVTASASSLEPAKAIGPAEAAAGRRIVARTDEDQAVPSTSSKLAEPTRVPAPHRPSPRDRRISKTNTITTLEIASRSIPQELGCATTGRTFSTSAVSSIGAAPPQEIERDDDRSLPHDFRTKSAHFARRMLQPILRIASLLLKPDTPREQLSRGDF